jgi:hypothetical protein
MSYLVKAIRSLKPNSEFVFQEEDYATIEWHKLEGKAPTQAEIDAEITRLQSLDATNEANKATQKAALLERLGITQDEARLLLS